MGIEHLEELSSKEKSYWWHVNRHRLVMSFLNDLDCSLSLKKVLEVGCGTGFLASQLFANGMDVIATDVLPEAVCFVQASGVTKKLVFNANQPWPFLAESFQKVIMLDVLEHIENDERCLQEARRVLCLGGEMVLTVPAHQYLYSNWDVVLGHYRRYTKKELREKLKKAGFKINVLSYHNFIAFFPALFLKVFNKGRINQKDNYRAEFPYVPKSVNFMLKLWGRIELSFIHSYIPAGLSLIAVAKS